MPDGSRPSVSDPTYLETKFAITDEDVRKAQLVLASTAIRVGSNAEELRLVLQMLGLTESPTEDEDEVG